MCKMLQGFQSQIPMPTTFRIACEIMIQFFHMIFNTFQAGLSLTVLCGARLQNHV